MGQTDGRLTRYIVGCSVNSSFILFCSSDQQSEAVAIHTELDRKAKSTDNCPDDFVGVKFYCQRVLADGNQHIQIGRRLLHCHCAINPYKEQDPSGGIYCVITIPKRNNKHKKNKNIAGHLYSYSN